MRIARGLAPARGFERGCAVAIGSFDGLHRGHQAILARLAEGGRERGLPLAVLTFEPHPREFLQPGAAPARLLRLRDKAELLAARGIDQLRVLRFNAALSRWDGAAFVARVLTGALAARHVVVGERFSFGFERSGDVELLRAEGARRGFTVDEVPAYCVDGEPVSSTRLRAALAEGDLALARRLLGRDFRISGRVVDGRRLGRQLGFPTANLRLHRRVPPVAGVFAVRATGGGLESRAAVASVGTRPTVGGTEWLLEVYVFDFDGPLYGERLDVDFIARLREERRYPDLESMKAQIREDARQARALLQS
ncbi:MAG: bifunctional riboflavin kinase/FAD synthetase [Gammaproteobacteria bacterium]|nr:bifunctional riboflavin kinase/FAD synthetase [Gammaproteobacteria bacterium]